jgi:hypothetical protein
MITTMYFLEPRICKRRCDHSNDVENPLLEATSSTAEGEHKEESIKENPSTPRPKWLMLALVSLAIFMKTMTAMISIQLSSQGPKGIPLFYLVGVIVAIVDVILVGVIFLVLADYFRFVVIDQSFFGKLCMIMAGFLLGLAFFATTCLMDVVVNFQSVLMGYYFQLTVLIGYYCFSIGLGAKRGSQTMMYHHWSTRFQSCLGFLVGLSLGVFMSMMLSAVNWGGLVQGGLTAPNLVSVLLASLLELAFFLAFTAGYLQAVSIIWNPEEAEDHGVEDEESYTSS